MVALLTPDFCAIASMLAASMPRSPNKPSAASRTFSCASLLRVLAMFARLQLNLRKQISSQRQESYGNRTEDRNIEREAKVRCVDKHAAQGVYAIGEWIESGDDGQCPGQIGQREQ